MYRRLAMLPWLLGALVFSLLATTGCGYSEEEWRAKLREIESLQNQLRAEQSKNEQAQRELDEAKAKVEQLKKQLEAAGVN
ncbi:MAG: hypothetical protein HY744_17755, partial [Deltaproteobacteria bacterium]|nr:hypothetical protein [Deltaproteobacteria bacterium]